MNEVAVNRVRARRRICAAVPELRKTGPEAQPNPRGGSADEEFWTMTATVVPGVIRSPKLDLYRGTGPVTLRPAAETPPEPAPTESEPPPRGDWEPRRGTVRE